MKNFNITALHRINQVTNLIILAMGWVLPLVKLWNSAQTLEEQKKVLEEVLRGRDCQLTWEMDPGHQRLRPLTLLPVLGIYVLPTIPTSEGAFKDATLRAQCVVETTWWYVRLNLIKASKWTFKILAGRCRDLPVLWLPKISLTRKFPCLLNLSPTHLGKPASFFSLALPLVHGNKFQFSPGQLLKLQTSKK